MAIQPYSRRNRTVNPDFSTSNPESMARQDRQLGYNYADIFGEDFADDEQRHRQRGDEYEGLADTEYASMVPGLDEDERRRILNDDFFRQGMATDEAYDSNFMSPDEWSANNGNPWDRNRAFNPGQMEERTREGAGWRRGAFGEGRTGLRSALDRTDQAADAALDGNESNVRGAVGRIRAGLDRDIDTLDGRLTGNADTTADTLAGIANDPNLGVSDEEIQRMQDQAGRVIGNRYRSRLNEVESAANRAGTTNPLAMAELKGRVDREMAGGAADATSDARLKGIALQREVAGLNADRKLGAAETGGLFRERAAGQVGQIRADVGTNLAGLETDAELNLGRNRNNSVLSRGQIRAGAEGDIMATGVGVENLNATDQNNMTQWNQETGLDVGRDIDNTQVDRARYNTENRQTVNMNNQDRRFDQYSTAANYGRQGGTIARQARQQDGAERRGYYTGQGQFRHDQSAQAGQRRIQGVGAGLEHARGGTSTMSSHKTNNPSLGRRLTNAAIGAGMSAASSYFGG